ncbi:mannose-6-phosphate isomerase-like protein (cupin superfamily) [Panacagrimonas perspica]|uniref:Mannose-6-phosphate isomerase-like protein (Cupin superfamily) n=1 Tax=Panacagrimonas perspica TaxID=381431 RepID=A0A4S3KAM1_9GAMM|nr:cupin domain-containing protein [Panacagrimonas perspica]TDU32478.1 mannose-6-phosphate isomerase-like protein (cupin superfamily) [Panacagrimonas perspica]THD05392.1 cupin 2 conserved barrel domain protein [Panacagrimonas perspica]
MNVTEQSAPVATPIPGIDHATWAGEAQGLKGLSVWRQSIAAGAATPPHRHDCDEVVLCHAGEGEVHSEGRVLRFGANTTLTLPAGPVHQIFSVGSVALELTGVFAQTPVKAWLPDGNLLELPWRS